jgi:hypothetical protein
MRSNPFIARKSRFCCIWRDFGSLLILRTFLKQALTTGGGMPLHTIRTTAAEREALGAIIRSGVIPKFNEPLLRR